VESLKNLPDKIERQLKYAAQVRFGWSHRRRTGFVFGCQRSGTKMILRVLEESPVTRIFHENDVSAFRDFELRSVRTVRALGRMTPAPVQIFKPICDSQRAADLLASFPDAHAVWVVRNPWDVANSASEKWGAHQREVITALVDGDLETWGWRTAQVPSEVVGALRSVWRPDLSDGEGALLWWYLRNALYFGQDLDRHPRVRLVRYEALVEAPEQAFEPLFRHLGVPWSTEHVGRVRASSVGRREPPASSDAIRGLCEELLARFDAVETPEAELELVSPVQVLIDTLGIGGAERYAVTVANWFAEHGVDVCIAARPGELTAELRGVRYVPLQVARVRLGLPVKAAQLRAAAGGRPRVIVANSLATTWLGKLAWPGVPIVNVAHGWSEDRYATVGKLMNVADRVVAVSPAVRRKLVDGGLAPHKCVVVHNGVETAHLGRRSGAVLEQSRAALGSEPVLVAVVGRLEPQKAQHHAIELATHLGPGVGFAIAGDGSREDELQALIDEAGVGDRVRLVGLRDDVPDLLGSADIYLNCSDWEGMPLTTIEAMASELPVVATATEGAEQLLDASCAVVVPVGDVAAMAEALRGLMNDTERRLRMGAAARARALEHFGHDRMVRQLAEVVAEVAW